VQSFIKQLKRIRDENRSGVVFEKIVLSNVNKGFRGHRYYTKQLEKQNLKIYQIPQDRKVSECVEAGQSLEEYAPRSRAIRAYHELAQEVNHAR
jgi:cellulose biosynthesis protein BcsQ